MIILTDTNCVIQTYFVLGPRLLRDRHGQTFEVHPYIRDELVGLGKSGKRPHLSQTYEEMLKLFPVTTLTIDANCLNNEKDALQDQFNLLKQEGKITLGQAPSNIDLTILAYASIHNCAIATLEHSLLGLARKVHAKDLVLTMSSIVELFLDRGLLDLDSLQENLSKFPKQEKLREEDRKAIDLIVARLRAERDSARAGERS